MSVLKRGFSHIYLRAFVAYDKHCQTTVRGLIDWMEKSMTKDEQAVVGRLRKKSHEELLFLVEQLLERKPDIVPLIELLIELPVPHSSQQGKTSGRDNNRTLN